jgi:hypothetical protein
VEFYNWERKHQSLEYVTPAEVYGAADKLSTYSQQFTKRKKEPKKEKVYNSSNRFDSLINNHLLLSNKWGVSKFNVIYKNGHEEDIPLDYYPGCLSIDDEGFEKLFKDSIANIKLRFIHSTFAKENQVSKEYEFNYRLDYLKYRFLVVEIYDLDIKEYGYRFEKNKKRGEKYVYEMQTSNFDYRVIPSH